MASTALTRSTQRAADASDLYQIFQNAWQQFLAGADVPAALQPVLVEEYPKTREGQFDHTFDVILMSVVLARPDKTNALGPRTREVIPIPDKAGYLRVTIGWWEDVMVRFDVMAKSNDAANSLLKMFHRQFLAPQIVLKFFESYGIKNLWLSERQADRVDKQDQSQELYVRPLLYSMRLESLIVAETKTLDSLKIFVPGTEPLTLSEEQ